MQKMIPIVLDIKVLNFINFLKFSFLQALGKNGKEFLFSPNFFLLRFGNLELIGRVKSEVGSIAGFS
jgi:hypothetical protein